MEEIRKNCESNNERKENCLGRKGCVRKANVDDEVEQENEFPFFKEC